MPKMSFMLALGLGLGAQLSSISATSDMCSAFDSNMGARFDISDLVR
jgi:hypothetical protein